MKQAKRLTRAQKVAGEQPAQVGPAPTFAWRFSESEGKAYHRHQGEGEYQAVEVTGACRCPGCGSTVPMRDLTGEEVS
jgi:hypothetical protein